MNDKASNLLILVDGSSYLYRAFYALPPLTNSRGEPTGAVYGVANMLRKLLADYQPDYAAVVFDAKGRTFRDELFEQYKAHRPPMPNDLQAQIEPLHALVRASGLPCLVVEGVEADDVIGTLAQRAAQEGIATLISTGDKDMAQLVNGHITLINTMSNTVLDRQGVIDKFGIAPEQIIDYLALVGDTTDNIPGIPKVGPKTACKWLQTYGSLDNLVAHATEVPGKVGENLRAHLDQLPLARRLATIHCDVQLDVAPADLVCKPPDTGALSDLYGRLEFKGWLKQLQEQQREEGGAAPPLPKYKPGVYETVTDEAALRRWLDRLDAAALFAFDTETTSLDYMRAEIVGVSFAVTAGEAAYIPLAHDYPGAPPQLPRDATLARLQPLLEDRDKAKLGHNLKYDMSVLANHGIRLDGARHDTMLESYVWNSTAARHDMDTLSRKYLDHATVTFEDVAGKGAKQLTFNQVALEEAAHYAAEDADVTFRLHDYLWPRLRAEPALAKLYDDIEVPLLGVLSRMERTGVLVDAELLRRQSVELAEAMAEHERRAHELAGGPFNLGSPKQIQEILYNQLKLPVSFKTPTGQPSTGEDALQELAEHHPLPALILDYRALSKLKSTYTDRLPEQIHPRTGRVHTCYQQAVAATGRLSSTDPNLQNIPIRSPEGRRIRQAFIAPPGYRIVAADYSQIELRIMAHLSGDERLRQAFASGLDIHTATAAEIFAVPPEQVSANQRRSAKAINFGLIYGMSSFGLARQLGIERGAAQEYIDLYFALYPGAKQFMDRTRDQARERGYVETVFGRRLYLPDIQSRQSQRRQYAERAAINAPMQGTAADIIKLAMLRCDRWLQESGADARMIMQVHDELVFEVADTGLQECTAAIEGCMKNAARLSVPLVVDIGTGANWDEAH
jgi:DNA polymerase-1